jgi:hypothetical protein
MISYQDLYRNKWSITPIVTKRFIYFTGLFIIITAVVIAYTKIMDCFKWNIKYW